MLCLKCGYVLDTFDTQCPKCSYRLGTFHAECPQVYVTTLSVATPASWKRLPWKWICVALVSGLLLCGSYAFILTGPIGPQNLPWPTHKTVKVSDVTGKWQYSTDGRETAVSLELKSDGTFVQTIPPQAPGGPRVYQGHWKLQDSVVYLDKAWRLTYDSTHSQSQWKLVSGYECWVIDDNPFTLFGGDFFQDDPDAGDEFQRIETAS